MTLAFVGNDGIEAEGTPLGNGVWLVRWLDSPHLEYRMIVDNMPDRWIELLRRWRLLRKVDQQRERG